MRSTISGFPCELAKALNNQGRPEAAVTCLRKLVRAHPENARAKNDLAMLFGAAW